MNCSRIFFFLVVAFSTLSCTKKLTVTDLQNLNGYWEIEKVETSGGETKEYRINTTIDYIELKDSLSGFRTKVNPMLDGTFQSNNDKETFTLAKKENNYIFKYKNDLTDWKETLKTIDKDHFIVTNTTGNTYYYKRFESLKKE